MEKKGIVKRLKETYGFGLAALGVYNISLLVDYFRSGMDMEVLPPKAELVVLDILLVVITVALAVLADIVIGRLHKNSGSSGR